MLGKDKSAVGAVGGEVGGELEKALLVFQKNEITEHMVYSRLAERVAKKGQAVWVRKTPPRCEK